MIQIDYAFKNKYNYYLFAMPKNFNLFIFQFTIHDIDENKDPIVRRFCQSPTRKALTKSSTIKH